MSTAASSEEPTPTTALRNSRAPSCSSASLDVASASTRGNRESLHAGGILFDGQDLVPQLVLRHRDGGPETAQPDDERSRLEFL